jgi:esterase/lipase superfamily enzyme
VIAIPANPDRRVFICMMGATALTACGERGKFIMSGPEQQTRQTRKVLYATNRAAQVAGVIGTERSNTLSYALLEIATPTDRFPGQLDFTGADAFTLAGQSPVNPAALSSALASTVQPSGMGQNRLMLWVHGFNNTPAEAVHRQVQIAQDIGHGGPAVTFVWPSAASAGGYIHDRDSALHARSALAKLLVSLREAWNGEIVVVAHSLGAFLTLEALGRIRLAGNQTPVIDSLMLIQPDIAADVFEGQIWDAQPLPPRTALVVSQDDPVLRFSARLSGQPDRVGATGNQSQFEALGLTVHDLTNVTDAEVPHLVAFTSPTVLEILRRFVASA